VLAALPQEGEAPFVAALPTAALENPSGPLGVVGHVDLAWTWGFVDHDMAPIGAPENRRERFEGLLQAFARGHRFGVAHHALARFSRSVSLELTALYDDATQKGQTLEAREGKLSRAEMSRNARQASLWMQRNDLAAYVLLGDPAARLPLARRPQGIPKREKRRSAAIDLRTNDPRAMEEAVLDAIRGKNKSEIAARYTITESELDRWLEVFLAAGRAALGNLR